MRLIDAINNASVVVAYQGNETFDEIVEKAIEATKRSVIANIEETEAAPTIKERKAGRWLEKKVFHEVESSTPIEQWQSAKCSVCGKYHTTPYLYYFNDYAFCPNCGVIMKEGETDD